MLALLGLLLLGAEPSSHTVPICMKQWFTTAASPSAVSAAATLSARSNRRSGIRPVWPSWHLTECSCIVECGAILSSAPHLVQGTPLFTTAGDASASDSRASRGRSDRGHRHPVAKKKKEMRSGTGEMRSRPCLLPTHNREPYDTLLYCPTSCSYRSVCGTDAACRLQF